MGRFITASLVVAVIACCQTASLERTAEEREVAIYTALITGGDGPMAQSLVFFRDGRVRLKSVGAEARWRTLRPTDKALLESARNSAAFRDAVRALPRDFACCDARELAVSFEKTGGSLDALRNPPSIHLNNDVVDPALREFLHLRDRLGRRYFGSRYWLVGRT